MVSFLNELNTESFLNKTIWFHENCKARPRSWRKQLNAQAHQYVTINSNHENKFSASANGGCINGGFLECQQHDLKNKILRTVWKSLPSLKKKEKN